MTEYDDQMDRYVDEIIETDGDKDKIRHIIFKVLKIGITEGIDFCQKLQELFDEFITNHSLDSNN